MKQKYIYIFTIISLVIALIFCLFNFVLYPTKYDKYINKYSMQYNLDKSLVLAIIKTESSFNPNAISKSNAIGLMQLMPATAKWIAEKLGDNYSEENLFNPETNIKYGCFYINYLYKKFNDMKIVICSYNAGETKVLNWIENGKLIEDKINIIETKNYLKKVMSNYEIYKNKI